MRTAFLNFKRCLNNEPSDVNFNNVSINSGNIVFSYSLANTIKCDNITSDEFHNDIVNGTTSYDNIVVRNFITINQNTDLTYFNGMLRIFKDKPIVPISLGIQCSDYDPTFKLTASAETVLKEIAERAIIGCRGEYTASILNKHGIKNTRVIGCPSLYLGANYNRRVVKKDFKDVKKVLSNWRTITNRVADNTFEAPILKWLKDNTNVFIEQTRCYANEEIRTTTLNGLKDFLLRNRKYFFIFEDWYNFARGYDFSIGARFHGNVVPVLAGVPSLFMYSDSRTKEMTDYFELPTLKFTDFDPSKPLEYYYDLADYSNFNKNYPKKLDNFIQFCIDNGLELNNGMEQFLDRKMNALISEKINALSNELAQANAKIDDLSKQLDEYKNSSVFNKLFGAHK